MCTTELTKCRFTGADRTTHRLNIVSNKIIPTNKIIWHELYVQQISAYEKHSFNGNFTGKSNYTKTTKIHDISFIFLIIQVIKIRRNMNENPTQKVYLYFCNHYLPWLIFLNYITLCYNIQIFNPWVVRSAPVNLHFVSSVVTDGLSVPDWLYESLCRPAVEWSKSDSFWTNFCIYLN